MTAGNQEKVQYGKGERNEGGKSVVSDCSYI